MDVCHETDAMFGLFALGHSGGLFGIPAKAPPAILHLLFSFFVKTREKEGDSAISGGQGIMNSSAQLESGLTRAARYLVPFVLLLIPFWRTKVNDTVPEPYMDEAFHVRQAQAYWAHNWTQWDPKITTPPGLYLWSYFLCACLRFLRGEPTELSTLDLRATNVAAMAIILPWRLQTLLDYLRKERNTRPAGAWLSHTVLNICLFPPLFFISGLYYTDVLALLVVIEAYIWDIRRSSDGRRSLLGTPVFLAFGLAALAFRQTNIFWVSVFFGGLHAVRRLREVCRQCKSSEFSEIAKKSSQGELYDPLVGEASISGASDLILYGVNPDIITDNLDHRLL